MKIKQFLDVNGLGFTVSKTNATGIIDNKVYNLKDSYITYRTDTNQLFGVVKSKYTIIQNLETLDFLDLLIENYELELVKSFIIDNGAKYMIQCKLPGEIFLSNGDNIQKYITIVNSHEGSWSCNLVISPIRLVCLNQLGLFTKSSLKQAINIKHTNNYKDKLILAESLIETTNKFYDIVKEDYNDLLELKIDPEYKFRELYFAEEEFQKWVDGENEIDFVSTKKLNILKEVLDTYHNHIGQDYLDDNGYKFINGLSAYLGKFYEKHPEKLVIGSGATLMNKAYKLLNN
jgi:Domain of unknown function (DUF932)